MFSVALSTLPSQEGGAQRPKNFRDSLPTPKRFDLERRNLVQYNKCGAVACFQESATPPPKRAGLQHPRIFLGQTPHLTDVRRASSLNVPYPRGEVVIMYNEEQLQSTLLHCVASPGITVRFSPFIAVISRLPSHSATRFDLRDVMIAHVA